MIAWTYKGILSHDIMGQMDYQEINWHKSPQLQRLADLSTPPKHLYFIGKWNEAIFENCVAVVGSRKMTDYGIRVVDKIIPRLVAQKQTIVSGFMYGVDQYAHQVCCERGGQTIAVLGWGISNSLSKEDFKLAKKIVEKGGLILSEWETQPPTHWTFPSRNRIVAALCQKVIVVEAAGNSGSLITARIAFNLKREVWAVPGPITSRTSLGANNLIAKGKAQMYLPNNSAFSNGQTNDLVLQALDNESLTSDELSRKLGWPVSKVGAQLSLLSLSGQITEIGGKYYIADAS